MSRIAVSEQFESLDKWVYQIQTYSPTEVKVFCVQDREWQGFRLSLKGMSTQKKLSMLYARRAGLMRKSIKCVSALCDDRDGLCRRHQVQIDNYLNALKRGGQLGLEAQVLK